MAWRKPPATDVPGIAKDEVVEEVQPLAVGIAFALDTIELLEGCGESG